MSGIDTYFSDIPRLRRKHVPRGHQFRREGTVGWTVKMQLLPQERERLIVEARARDVAVSCLVAKLLAHTCESNLFNAVLED